MKTNPNDAAFFQNEDAYREQTGLTKREYFAAIAMQGICVQCIPGMHNSNTPVWNLERASQAVNMADALIEKLNGEKSE